MGALQHDTEVRRGDDGRLTADLSRDWEIWGPAGGYVSAVALRAAGKIAPPDHRPATYSCQYLSAGPFGTIMIEAEPVRRGRNAWCINVTLKDGDKRFLQAQIWTTNKADGPRKIDCTMPDVPGPAALRPYQEFLGPDAKPHPFWNNFDSRHVDFIAFKDGCVDPRGSVTEHWFRFNGFEPTTDPFLDCGRPLLLVDQLPWTTFHRGLAVKPKYIAPTLDVTVWFHEMPGPADWLFCDTHSDVAGGGLIHGRVRVWSEDGRILATGGSNMMHVAPR